jgi:hypothetical protein
MKTLRILLVLSACVILCGTASAQSAPPTITFNVPLQLHDLHQDVVSIRVIATVKEERNSGYSCGQAVALIPRPADGNINQTATIVVPQAPGHDITKATYYTVAFLILLNDSAETPSQSTDAPIQARAKEGTAFTQTVEGTVAW